MTSPFTDELNEALRQAEQGGIIDLYGGLKVFPQYHCCISGSTVGVYKDPVAILEVDEQSVCEGENVCVSFSKSYSATSTITLWSIDWDDGNTSNGAWPPPASVCHPAGGYTFAGVYTIVLTITDILGASDQDAQQVNVLYCPMLWVPPPGVVVGVMGFGAVYTDSLVVGGTTWYDMQSSQLNVPGAKDITALKFVRNHINNQWHVFAGTGCGLWRYDYMPAGTGSWSYVLTAAQMISIGGYAFTDSQIWEIDCALDNPGRVVATFGANNWPWSGHAIIVSSDYFTTVDRIVYIYQGNFPIQAAGQGGCRMVQGSGGNTIYTANSGRIFKSTNAGGGWNQVFSGTGADEGNVHTPYVSEHLKDSRVYCLYNNSNAKDTSTDGGSSWATMGNNGRRPSKVNSSPYHYDTAEYISRDAFTRWSGGAYTTLLTLSTYWGRDFLATMRDNSGNLQEAALVGDCTTGAFVHLWDPSQTGGVISIPCGNCDGNINTVTGGGNARAIADYNYGWPRGV